MNTIIQISGREAIPIRAIPFVTGWLMSPDVVAKLYAHTDSWITKLVEVYAFNLSDDGSYVQTLPKEWDGVIADLESLSNRIKIDESYEGGSYAAWRSDSATLLPPGCFVWKDEFKKVFAKAYSKNKLTLIDERLGERELNFSPMVLEKLQTAVMQGFEKYLPNIKSVETIEQSLMTIERESLLRLVIGMAMAGYKYDPNSMRNSATAEISADLEKLGIGLDQDTVKKWLKKAVKVLPIQRNNKGIRFL